MSLAQTTITWDARNYLARVREAMEGVTRDGADYVAEEAKKNLERAAPDSTGTLASQIDVAASKFKDGGYIVEAQGRGNYGKFYASFVELGTSKMAGLAYLRRALRRGKFYMRKSLLKRLEVDIR